jgi:hypothetical protein
MEWGEVTATDVKSTTWTDPPSTENKSLGAHLTAFGPACCGSATKTRFAGSAAAAAAAAWSTAAIGLVAGGALVVLGIVFGLKKKGCSKTPSTPDNVAVTALPVVAAQQQPRVAV